MARKVQARCNKCVFNNEGKECDMAKEEYQTNQSFQCSDYERDKNPTPTTTQLTVVEPKKLKPRIRVHTSDVICYRINES